MVGMIEFEAKRFYIWNYNLFRRKFTIRRMDTGDMGKTWDVSGHTQYTFDYPYYFRRWSYNGFNRVPGGEILAGDFDGNGTTDIAMVFQDDLPQDERSSRYFGGTVRGIRTHFYTWNSSTSKFEFSSYGNTSWGMSKSSSETRIPYGGLKAVKADIDGDGKDEIVMAYLRSFVTSSKTTLKAYLSVLGMDDGKIKFSDHPFTSAALINKAVDYDDRL